MYVLLWFHCLPASLFSIGSQRVSARQQRFLVHAALRPCNVHDSSDRMWPGHGNGAGVLAATGEYGLTPTTNLTATAGLSKG